MDITLYTTFSELLPVQQQKEPDPKRLKVSYDIFRMGRQKIAIFMGYNRAAYYRTRSTRKVTKTIEEELGKALYMAGANDNKISKNIVLAQTDDNVVNVVGQVASGRFYVDPKCFVQNVIAYLPADIRVFGYRNVTRSFHVERSCDVNRYVYLIPVFALDPASHPSGGENECLECSRRGTTIASLRSSFSYGEEENKTFNRILSCYVGHSLNCLNDIFNNNIVSFQANAIVTLQGMEFVKCEIMGHRFAPLQIRMIMGLAVAIMRGLTLEQLTRKRFRKQNFNAPIAPDVGLYLDECFFTSYNDTKVRHEEVSMKPFEEEAEYFKMKHIFSHIGSKERKEGIFALWLHTLNHHNFPNLNPNLIYN